MEGESRAASTHLPEEEELRGKLLNLQLAARTGSVSPSEPPPSLTFPLPFLFPFTFFPFFCTSPPRHVFFFPLFQLVPFPFPFSLFIMCTFPSSHLIPTFPPAFFCLYFEFSFISLPLSECSIIGVFICISHPAYVFSYVCMFVCVCLSPVAISVCLDVFCVCLLSCLPSCLSMCVANIFFVLLVWCFHVTRTSVEHLLSVSPSLISSAFVFTSVRLAANCLCI